MRKATDTDKIPRIKPREDVAPSHSADRDSELPPAPSDTWRTRLADWWRRVLATDAARRAEQAHQERISRGELCRHCGGPMVVVGALNGTRAVPVGMMVIAGIVLVMTGLTGWAVAENIEWLLIPFIGTALAGLIPASIIAVGLLIVGAVWHNFAKGDRWVKACEKGCPGVAVVEIN